MNPDIPIPQSRRERLYETAVRPYHSMGFCRNSATAALYLSGISRLVQWLASLKVIHLTFGIPEK